MSELKKNTLDYTAVPITRRTLDKVLEYAKIAGDFECYGFLLTPTENRDGVVYQAILAPNQTVAGGHAGIDGLAAVAAKAEIENMGYTALGFWHSHGSIGAFHSPTDDQNMEHLLLSFAGNSEVAQTAALQRGYFVDGDSIVARGDLEFVLKSEGGGPTFMVTPHSDEYSELVMGFTRAGDLFINDGKSRLITRRPSEIALRKPVADEIATTGVAYSIVVNRRGEVFAELATDRWCYVCDRQETGIRQAELNIVTVEPDIAYTKDELKGELRSKASR